MNVVHGGEDIFLKQRKLAERRRTEPRRGQEPSRAKPREKKEGRPAQRRDKRTRRGGAGNATARGGTRVKTGCYETADWDKGVG